MTDLEALHWSTVIMMSKKGNTEMTNYLEVENKLRKEQNLPSVEEELQEIAEEAEITKMVEAAKKRLSKKD